MKSGRLETSILLFMTILLLFFCAVKGMEEVKTASADIQEEDGKKVALTFDDGPHKYYTQELLDGLRERQVIATFFLIGESIEGKEDVVKQMHEDGHLIGNHTYTHVQLNKEKTDDACAEVWKTNTKIFDVTGEVPYFIRPPFGEWNEELSCVIDMSPVLWDLDPLDWKYQDKDRIVKYVVKNVRDGDIILLHDVYKTSVQAALEIVDILKKEGYEFVTVEELIFD